MKARSLHTFGFLLFAFVANAAAAENSNPGDFKLAAPGQAADIYVDQGDAKVAHIAADCLAGDVEMVSGVRPKVKESADGLTESSVFIGTIGKSAVIDRLIREQKLDVSSVSGKWETFLITTVSDPVPGVKSGLVIAGSDRRGTAFGVFEVSEMIGVSPWVWWDDITPTHQDTLTISNGAHSQGPPSVKYRGIFINDEDWGLQPWAAKTLEPEVGDIGPKTYARVCELLLRLKANYLWPAMHECTRAFNTIPENKVVADEYAIVMGSSHAEPMLFNNATEWKLPKDAWNYETNANDIKAVWEKRVQENGKYENSYTVGIRGIHDSAMQGGGTIDDGVKRLERVIADQRSLLAKYVNPKVEEVFQTFVPYKEVLPYYQHGMKVPDDVTLVWVDDNFGYIRQLSNPAEQKRSGGSGVYYHLSYWGLPEDYLWIDSTPLALIWSEMSKAYDQGARTVWVANVGDIKPTEIGMEFFLRMGWDIKPFDENSQMTFLKEWAERDFGKSVAAEIAAIMDEYYRLNFAAKPEHLHLVSFTSNYNETEHRLQRFSALVQRANAIYENLPQEEKDGFYEKVIYQVRGAALANEMNWNPSNEVALKAYDQLQAETKFFNEQIAGGKWRHVISSNPRNRPALRKPDPAKRPAVALAASLDSSKVPDTTSISVEAAHPTRKIDGDNAKWKVIGGLGRAGDSVSLLPTTAGIPETAALEYDFTSTKEGAAKVLVDCIPTHPLNPSYQVRYSVSIDGEPPREVNLAAKEYSKQWSANVISNAAIGTTEHTLAKPGKHTLVLRPLDPGLIFDAIVIDFGDLKASQVGPPENTEKHAL